MHRADTADPRHHVPSHIWWVEGRARTEHSAGLHACLSTAGRATSAQPLCTCNSGVVSGGRGGGQGGSNAIHCLVYRVCAQSASLRLAANGRAAPRADIRGGPGGARGRPGPARVFRGGRVGRRPVRAGGRGLPAARPCARRAHHQLARARRCGAAARAARVGPRAASGACAQGDWRRGAAPAASAGPAAARARNARGAACGRALTAAVALVAHTRTYQTCGVYNVGCYPTSAAVRAGQMAPAERAEWDSGVGAATAAFAGLYRYHPAVAAALRAWALTRPGGALLFWAVLRPLALNAKRTMAAPDAACLDRDHPEYFGVRLQALLAQGLQTPLGQGWQTSLGQGVQAAMGAPTQRVPRGGPRRTTTPLSLSSRAAGEGSRCSARGRGRSACMRSNSLHVIGQCWERRRTAMQARSCHMQMRSRTLQWCLSGTLRSAALTPGSRARRRSCRRACASAAARRCSRTLPSSWAGTGRSMCRGCRRGWRLPRTSGTAPATCRRARARCSPPPSLPHCRFHAGLGDAEVCNAGRRLKRARLCTCGRSRVERPSVCAAGPSAAPLWGYGLLQRAFPPQVGRVGQMAAWGCGEHSARARAGAARDQPRAAPPGARLTIVPQGGHFAYYVCNQTAQLAALGQLLASAAAA